MLVILNFLNAHYFPTFQQILMICMFQIVLSDKTYLSLGFLSPLGLLLQRPSINADEDVSHSVFMESTRFCSCVFTKKASINVGRFAARPMVAHLLS